MDRTQWEKYRKLGLNVSFYRRSKNFTQMKLAELVDIDRTHIGDIELARSGVSLDVLFRLADVLEVPINKFFEFKD